MSTSAGILLINKKARFDYQILETFQAGMVLEGEMVKMITGKKVNLLGKFIVYQQKQLQIIGFGNEKLTKNVPLLVKKKELANIRKGLSVKGISCVPLSIKRVRRWLKVEIATVKGLKLHNKKDILKNRDIQREMQRESKSY
jgi:SsrA-binding protein